MILHHGAGPGTGPDSFDERNRALLAGFFAPGIELPFGQRKIAAGRLRARVAAVELWATEGTQPSHRALAARIGMSDRCLSYQFPKQSELYAFPPPELARSLVLASSSSRVWSDMALLIRPVFEALETNTAGRSLLAGLVTIHRANPDLGEIDAYFAMALRSLIRDHRHRRTLSIANLFTAGIRMAFEDWVDAGEPNLEYVADRAGRFLVGPINDAYEALLALEPAELENRRADTKRRRKPQVIEVPNELVVI